MVVSFQQSIAVSGTAQNLPNNHIVRSVTIAAPSTNAAAIVLGNAPTVTATTGYLLQQGQSVRLIIHGGNTNSLWALGTAGDVLSVAGV
ncbi:MAG: hypothetical protein HIU91_10045 [Acidobacteria bacterium]|nr:hypothetical protein [Acidobacteriota bacterium]